MEQNTTQPVGTPLNTPPTPPTYVPPAYSAPPTPPAPPIKRPTFASDRQDSVLAAILLALSVLLTNFALYGWFRLGYAMGCLAVLITGGIYLHKRLGRTTTYSVFCLTAAVATTGVFVWHSDGFARFLAVCGMLLSALAVLDASGLARRDSGTIAVVGDLLRITVLRPFSHIGYAIPAIFRIKKGDTIEKRRFGGALLGLLCAIPVLLVVVPLLLKADAAFEGLLENSILDHFGEIFVSIWVGVQLFILLFSLLFGLRHRLPEKPAEPQNPRQGIAAMGLNSFLSTISAVYVLYLFSQLAYFFSAFSGILPKDYTVAEYARRGFFEMCAICAINLVLVAVCLGLSRKQAGKAPLSTRCIALFILLFSMGLVATALSKMVLYIGSFGMTRLRILTAVFMVMLAVVVLFVIVRLFSVRFPYMKATVIAVTLIGLTVGYTGLDAFITRYNVTAYQQGQLEELDVGHLTDLSEGATPYLVELWSTLKMGDTHHRQLTNHLRYQLDEYGCVEWDEETQLYTFTPNSATDFRKFNVDCRRAREAVAEQADAILEAERRYSEHDKSRYDDTDYSDIDYERSLRNGLLADYMGEYYDTHLVESLGEIVLFTGEEATLYHTYHPNAYAEYEEYRLGSLNLTPYWVSKPYELGLYVVTDECVYTIEEAYNDGWIDLYDLQNLIPSEMIV